MRILHSSCVVSCAQPPLCSMFKLIWHRQRKNLFLNVRSTSIVVAPLPSKYVPQDLVRRRRTVSLAGPVITSTGIGASVRQCGCFMICRPEGPLCALAVLSPRVGGAILRAIPHKIVATLAHTCIHQMLNFAVPAAL